ncbi:glycoside hydrolase family 38 C-terminal domain-containing protein [Xylanibacter brevis]|uniref:glycoside hydrolase family 38 C-terminal domain-containing protein n=1 Tax=Xylanibacter brevis TaxID=83231 RepID=UPI0012DCA213|nr:glycoside hydrolase family 38 C-terminal domain-containing protein [Xylanibacter brevis]
MMTRRLRLFLCAMLVVTAQAQTSNFFVDGFHGGLYGHYPLDTYTQFMVDQLERYPDWRIGLEIEPETWDTVAVRTPEAYRLFKQKMMSSQVEVTNPTYAQPYLYNINGESIIRQFQYGMQKLRSHFPGISFNTYSSEEPCYTSQLPQLLRLLGFKYVALKCPDTCWGGYTEAHGGQLVNLVGPDGSKMIAVPRYACEKLQEGSVWQTIGWTNSEEYIRACEKAGIENPVGMCYQDAGWTYGPWLRDRKGQTQYVRWTDYIDRYTQKKNVEEWRWSQEDIHPGLMWGSQVMQRIGRQVRQAENLLVQAEKLGVLTGHRMDQWQMDEAWRTLMLAQHHDSWIVPYNNLKDYGTWADAIRMWTDSSVATARKMMSDAIAVGKQGGPYVTFYNTTAHRRQEVATTADGRLLWVDVPAFGQTTCRVDTAVAAQAREDRWQGETTAVLENDQYRLTFDLKRGGIVSSWIDKQQGGRELVDQRSTSHFGELKGYFNQHGGMRSSTESVATATCLADHPLKQQIRIDGHVAGVPFSHTITLTQGQRRVDCQLTINWTEDTSVGDPFRYRSNANRTPYYDTRYMLRMLFPVALQQPRLSKDAPFDVCESRLDDTFYNRWDSIKHNVVLNWVDLSEGRKGQGFALLSDHTTSYSYGADEPLALTVQYAGDGLWWRRYPINGATEMNYALVPHQGRWDQAQLQDMVDDWHNPLVASGCHAQQYPTRQLLAATCQLSAAMMQDDGAMILRLFNADGKGGREQLRLGFPVKDVVEVDLNGEPLAHHRPDAKGTISMKMPRFAIKTLKIYPER